MKITLIVTIDENAPGATTPERLMDAIYAVRGVRTVERRPLTAARSDGAIVEVTVPED